MRLWPGAEMRSLRLPEKRDCWLTRARRRSRRPLAEDPLPGQASTRGSIAVYALAVTALSTSSRQISSLPAGSTGYVSEGSHH